MKNLLFAITILSFSVVAFGQDGNFKLDKTYRIKKTGTIDLACSDANVFITGSDRPDVHVKIERTVKARGWVSGDEDFRVDVNETGGDLKIREVQRGANVSFGYYEEDYRIEIEAPQGASLVVHGDDGDYFIKNIGGSISLSLDDADAELADCSGKEFRFRFDDGDLHMNQGRGLLEIDADDADVEIYNGNFTSIEADVDDGDLRIETSLADNGDYHLTSQDGLIALDITGGGGTFDIQHDDASVSVSDAFTTTTSTEDHTKATLAKGNAKVSVRADDARVKLTARN